MAKPTDAAELRTAWRAQTEGSTIPEGWRTIPVATHLPVRIRAGRHFPGNEEALLVGFTSAIVPAATKLPEGRGFLVSRLDAIDGSADVTWIGLSRLAPGSLEIFSAMAADILSSLSELHDAEGDQLLQCFLSRISAWQYFMERGGAPILSHEAEVGLYGELLILEELLDLALPAAFVVAAWRGPFGGLHDFRLGTGAIEVKSSLVANGFAAWIGSMDQLDATTINPLVLAAVRLALDASGRTLPELASRVSQKLSPRAAALQAFGALVIRAGLLEIHIDHYTRRFEHAGTRLFPVTSTFPRLIRSDVPAEITRVQYEMDLDRVNEQTRDLQSVLRDCGVM